MGIILDNRLTGMDPAGNAVLRYIAFLGDTTLSNKLAVAACVDRHILTAMETAGETFDNTPDHNGVTPAMIFAQRAKTAALIAQSATRGVRYDLHARDIRTGSVEEYARRNDRKAKETDVILAAIIKVIETQEAAGPDTHKPPQSVAPAPHKRRPQKPDLAQRQFRLL